MRRGEELKIQRKQVFKVFEGGGTRFNRGKIRTNPARRTQSPSMERRGKET